MIFLFSLNPFESALKILKVIEKNQATKTVENSVLVGVHKTSKNLINICCVDGRSFFDKSVVTANADEIVYDLKSADSIVSFIFHTQSKVNFQLV